MRRCGRPRRTGTISSKIGSWSGDGTTAGTSGMVAERVLTTPLSAAYRTGCVSRSVLSAPHTGRIKLADSAPAPDLELRDQRRGIAAGRTELVSSLGNARRSLREPREQLVEDVGRIIDPRRNLHQLA